MYYGGGWVRDPSILKLGETVLLVTVFISLLYRCILFFLLLLPSYC